MYSARVIEHFSNPLNAGEITDVDGVGTVGNSADKDVIVIYVKIKENRIVDARFEALGCGVAVAMSSMVTMSERLTAWVEQWKSLGRMWLTVWAAFHRKSIVQT